MVGLKVDFKGFEDSRILMERGEGFDLVVQNTLVNLGQEKGSATIFPDKGTVLRAASLRGFVGGIASASRLGGIAAVDTIYFLRANDVEGGETLADLALVPSIEEGKLSYELAIKSTLDRSVGIPL